MTPQLIVFDMAGTTVRDGDAVHAALQGALASVGVRAGRPAVNAVMGMPKPHAIERLLAEGRGREAVTTRIVEAVHDDFQRRMLGHYRWHPDVVECDGASDLFSWCRERGLKVALDTGFDRRIADAIIDRLGWAERGLLDATVTSDEVPRGRPHPDMILRLMALTGVSDASRVMKVGDTPVDLAEGHAAGCGAVVAMTSGSHTAAELLPFRPTHLIAALSELRAIVAAPAEGAA